MNIPVDLSMHSLWDDLFQVVRRRKKLVAIVAIVMSIVVYSALSFMGDKYEAKASLLVKLGRANAEQPLTVEKGGVFTDGVRKEEVNSYISLLKSRPLLESTIDSIGLERFAYKPEKPKSFFKKIKAQAKAVARWGKAQLNQGLIKVGLRADLDERELLVIMLEKNLLVEIEKDTNVIALSLRLSDPILAQEILDELIKLYMERHIMLVQTDGGVVDAFENQVSDDREAVKKLQESKREIREALNIGVLAEQQRLLVGQQAKLSDDVLIAERTLSKLRTELSGVKDRLEVEKQNVLGSVTEQPSPAQQAVKNRLVELEISRAEMVAKFKEGSPSLEILDDELLKLKSIVSEDVLMEVTERVMNRNPLVDLLQSKLISVSMEISALEVELVEAKKQDNVISNQIKELNKAAVSLRMIELETEVAEQRFLTHASRRQDAQAQELLNKYRIANISVLSPPSFSWKPVAPRRLLMMLGGIVGGLAIGLGLALFLEWQNKLVREPEDLVGIDGATYLGAMNFD